MTSIPINPGRKPKNIEITPEHREFMKKRQRERNKISAKAHRERMREHINDLEVNANLLDETITAQKQTIETQAKIIREMQIEIDELKKQNSICCKCANAVLPIYAEVIDVSNPEYNWL